MSKYLIKASKELLDATRAEWQRQVDGYNAKGVRLVPQGYEQYLSWCGDLLDGSLHAPDAHVYAHKRPGESHAAVIACITHAKPKSPKATLKLLDICLEPKFDDDIDPPGQLDITRITDAGEVLGQTIASCLVMTYDDHPAKIYKIYARTTEMVRLFEHLIVRDTFRKKLSKQGIGLRLEGKWLVFDKNLALVE